MTKHQALIVLLIIGIAGTLFSGFLSYQELFAACPGVCEVSPQTSQILLGLPPCVYGLVMYLTVVVISLLGLRSKK